MDSLVGEEQGHQLIRTEANPLHAVVWLLTGIWGEICVYSCTQAKTLTTIKPLLLPLLNSRQSNHPKTWWGCFKVGGLLQGHPFQPFARSPPPCAFLAFVECHLCTIANIGTAAAITSIPVLPVKHHCQRSRCPLPCPSPTPAPPPHPMATMASGAIILARRQLPGPSSSPMEPTRHPTKMEELGECPPDPPLLVGLMALPPPPVRAALG